MSDKKVVEGSEASRQDPLADVNRLLEHRIPHGVDRRSFLMRTAVGGAAAAGAVSAAGGGAARSVSDRVQPFITAAAEITALRMMNFRRSRPAGISDGTCAGGSNGSRLSSFTSSLLDMAPLCIPFRRGNDRSRVALTAIERPGCFAGGLATN